VIFFVFSNLGLKFTLLDGSTGTSACYQGPLACKLSSALSPEGNIYFCL
jgi:hypothetical protein